MSDEEVFRQRSLKRAALAAVREGNIEQGINFYKEYIEVNPTDDDAIAGLGGAYRREGDLDSAIEQYVKAVEVNPESTYAAVNVVSLYALQGDGAHVQAFLPQTMDLTQAVIERGEDDQWTWYDRALLHLLSGETDKAQRDYEYALDGTRQPEHVKSVLGNLETLLEKNPDMPGLADAVDLVRRRLQEKGGAS